MNFTEYADKIFYNVRMLQMNNEDKFEHMLKTEEKFTQMNPLIVKYMCLHNLYDSKLFKEYIDARNVQRPAYKETFAMQRDYIKKLLVKNKRSRHEALKISNEEYEDIMSHIRHLEKMEKNIKRDNEKAKKIYEKEKREEFKYLVNKMIAENEYSDKEDLISPPSDFIL